MPKPTYMRFMKTHFFRLGLSLDSHQRVLEEVFHRFQLFGSGAPMPCWSHLEILSSWFLQSQEGGSETMDMSQFFFSNSTQTDVVEFTL